MSETRLKELADRKQLLLVQSEVNRRMIETEQLALRSRINTARDAIRDYRWPLIAGAFGAGMLGARNAGRILRWIPAVLGAIGTFRRNTER